MDSTWLVYKYTSPSGKSYIGQTCDMVRRAREHRNPNSRCSLFSNAIKKHGFDNFRCDVLAINLSLEEANAVEEQLIAEYDTLTPSGYNLLPGGSNHSHSTCTRLLLSSKNKGRKQTKEQRLQKSKARIGLKHSAETILKLKKPKTPEHIQKIALANTGKIRIDNHKLAISIANTGNIPWNKGIKLTAEHIQKLSDSHLGHISPNKGITYDKVCCPFCNKIGGGPQMKKWHFDNCKLNKETV